MSKKTALLTAFIPEAEVAAAVGFAPTSPSDSTSDSTLMTNWKDSAQRRQTRDECKFLLQANVIELRDEFFSLYGSLLCAHLTK